MTASCRFAILNPPLPSALSLVRLWGDVADLFDRALPEQQDVHKYLRMLDVDEGVVSRSHDGSLLFTPHGGAGVLDALRERLTQAGFIEIVAPKVDVDFAQSTSLYQRAALELLPNARSDAQLELLLNALQQEAHHALDLEEFAASWSFVRRWFLLPRVVLVGEPNAGKSTLFNALAQVSGAGAIVSEIAGTTRDYLSAQWQLPNGAVVELVDTAGLRDDSMSSVEAAGIEKSRSLLASADCVLVLQEWNKAAPTLDGVKVATKCDDAQLPDWADLSISVEQGLGLEVLSESVQDELFPELPKRPLALNAEMASDAQAMLATPKAFIEKWFASCAP